MSVLPIVLFRMYLFAPERSSQRVSALHSLSALVHCFLFAPERSSQSSQCIRGSRLPDAPLNTIDASHRELTSRGVFSMKDVKEMPLHTV